MGWFNKKDKKEGRLSLPELPRLPELPGMYKEPNLNNQQLIPQLPSYPSSSFGEKFSQNAIKDAVSGEEEDFDEEDFDADESMDEDEDEKMMMQKPLTREEPTVHRSMRSIPQKNEPVFVRLDKFEDGLKIFEETKHRISEMEKMLKDIKRTKEEEEKELNEWESEIQRLKGQFEKIDRDIFSKIY
jgi:hypothetical protein